MIQATATEPADVVLLLRAPPGSNHRMMPAMVKGRPRLILTPEARAWLDAAKVDVMIQRRGLSITNRAGARIGLSSLNPDADAGMKLLFDALEGGGAVANDRNIRPYFVCDDPSIPDGMVRVELWDSGEPMPKRSRVARFTRRTSDLAIARTFRGRR